jgi:hypothetical protein
MTVQEPVLMEGLALDLMIGSYREHIDELGV